MRRFRDKRKVISLTIVGIAYALIITPLIINNLQKQQELRGHAQVASDTPLAELSAGSPAQTAQSQCTAAGKGEIGIAYTNTDAANTITVTAVDAGTSQSINLGTIEPGETKTSTFPINGNAVIGSTVTFTATDVADPNKKQQGTASYITNSCTPASQNVISQAVKPLADVPATCGNVTTDVVLIIDRSGSMGENNKLVQAKNAAKNFIDVVSNQESTTRISLVAFSTDSTISSPLSTDFVGIKAKIDALTASGNTCHECGVKSANQEITAHGRAGVKKVVLLLTDGESNWVSGGTSQVSAANGESKAMAAVNAGFAQSKTVFFTIGFDIKSASAPQFLTNIAATTGGKYYFPAPNELDGVYQEISQLIGKGLLGGFLFNDSNVNGAYDANEPKLPGWTIQAVSSAGTKSAVTDANGAYSIGGLCDGSYTLGPVQKTGWTQTLPTNGSGYAINISNASQFTDKIFGYTDKARCEDTIDNDGNGFKDSADSTCHTDGNPKNPSSYNPKKDGERGGGNTCADSKDNNGDGTIDGGDPVCHTDGNPNNPGTYDPSLPEITTTTSMVCSPSTLAVTSLGQPLSVTLKDASGKAVSGKTITWTSANTNVSLSPASVQTNASGSAVTTASVPVNYPSAITTTITANFAGTTTNAKSSCSVQVSYSPLKTSMLINTLLDGIGSRGDNTNPTDSSLSNKDPKHPTIGADIQIYNLDNQLIASGTGSITYVAASGSYKGDVPIQIGFPTGKYIVKIKADTYLRKMVTGIQNITAGQQNTITTVPLVAGDVNNDNQLNILDYNALLDCYSDLSPAANCSVAEKSVKTDLNDDNAVNQIDYNLFLREISTQPGQ